MADHVTYKIDRGAIAEGKMNLSVTNLYPTYSGAQGEAVKMEIEKQLFAVFSKYAPKA